MARERDLRGDDLEFLLKDFDHWSSSYATNEELGEKRVSFFMGLITATFGGIAFLIEENSTNVIDLFIAAAFAALVLLLFGLLTLLRIQRRNKQTNHFLELLGELRHRLAPHWASTVGDVLSVDHAVKRPRSILNGGYAYIVALLNSALCTILVWTISKACRLPDSNLVPAAALAVGVLAMSLHIVLLRERSQAVPNTFRAGVGALVANAAGAVLALERKDHAGALQLPQGGIERDETALDAVYRELEEETGLARTDLTLIAEHPVRLAYELPPAARSPKTGRGQAQRWYLFRISPGAETKLRPNEEARRLVWANLSDLAETAIEFRRPIYAALFRELWPRLGERGL